MIVVVAVLAVGLPWCRTGDSSFLAKSTAVVSSDSREPEAHAHLKPLVEEILQNTTTDEQLGGYLAHDPELRAEMGAADDHAAIEILRRRLEISHDRIGGQVTISLSFYSTSQKRCTELLAQIMKDFSREFNDWKRHKSSEIQGTYSDQYEQASSSLVTIDAQLRGLRSHIPTQTAPRPVHQTQQRRLNPDWQAANSELTEIQTKLRGLLEIRTASHPMVINQQHELEEASAKLAGIPRYLDPAPVQQVSQPELPKETSSDEQIAGLERERQKMDARLTELGKLKMEADKALGFLAGITMEVSDDQIQITEIGRDWNASALLVLFGWAIFAGLVSFQMASSASRPAIVSDENKLAAVSPIPVLASVPVGPAAQPPPAKPWPLRGVSFWLTRFAEITILSLIGLVVLATQSQPEFSQLLKHDPMAAIREVLRVLPFTPR